MNYNTEIILNPIYQNSDFDINPVNLDIGIDFGLIDFSIEISVGSNVIFVDQVNSDWNSEIGLSKILNKPYIPINVSDLYNDSNFITIQDVPIQVNSNWNSNSGYSEILNKPLIPSISYQSIAPVNPQLNDIWVSSTTLIQYQWIGAWVNFNIQSLVNLTPNIYDIDGGNSILIPTSTIDGGYSNQTLTNTIDGGNAGPIVFVAPDGGNSSVAPSLTVDGGLSNSIIDIYIDGGFSI